MPANYVLLQRIELNAAVASVYFGNIPQSGYTDLKIVASVRDSYSDVASAMQIFFNGSSTSFSQRFLQGSGTVANSGTTPAQFAGNDVSATATSNTFSNVEIYIPNYLSSTNKSFSVDSVTENNATAAYANLIAGLWSNTAAINSITLAPVSGQALLQYSTFSLYGLAATGTTPVIAPKASGGNITSDGTYWYHTFLSTGSFVPAQGLSCDVLVVAGGGGAGYSIGTYAGGAGGGAGGYRTATSLSFASSTSYTATVGAGGAVSSAGSKGTSGSNSVISTITSSGGGGGGASNGVSATGFGIAGGSGGGSTYSDSGSKAGGAGNAGSYSPVEGYAGGSAGSANNGGAGGGGAAAVGSNNPSPDGGGAGGSGSNSLSSWASVTGTGVSGYYAGGGGGGSYSGTAGVGGNGGGGAGGASATNGTSGTVNTGGGGGGNGSGNPTPAVPGAGGSGIVIIRYPIA